MELDMLEVLLSHLEHIARVGQEDVPTLFVLRHILILALLKGLELGRIVARYPAGFIKMYGLPTALGVVLVFQTVLNNLELQLTHSTDNLTVVELIDKQLGHTLVHKLVNALLQLLGLHGIIVFNIFEQLGRERRQTAEVKLLALGNGVADLKDATSIGQTNDVAWPRFVDGTLALGHELCGRGEAHGLALTYVQIGLVTLEFS